MSSGSLLLMPLLPVLAAVALMPAMAAAFLDQAPDSGISGPPPDGTVWTDALPLGVRGRGWPADKMDSPYARLPTHAHAALCTNATCAARCAEPQCEAKRCAVWGLSTSSTGLHFKFRTSATAVHVRFTMQADNGDWLWALNGHSGIDLYV